MANQPDFVPQRGMIEEIFLAAGYLEIFSPNFYCQLKSIDNLWRAARHFARSNCDYTWVGLRDTVPRALDSILLKQVQRYARISQRYMDVYRKGLIEWQA